MKAILALAFTILTFAASPSATHACDAVRPISDCAPVSIRTMELCCHTECRWATNSRGRCYSYKVRVVTYADYYNEGYFQHYNVTYRS